MEGTPTQLNKVAKKNSEPESQAVGCAMVAHLAMSRTENDERARAMCLEMPAAELAELDRCHFAVLFVVCLQGFASLVFQLVGRCHATSQAQAVERRLFEKRGSLPPPPPSGRRAD